MDRCCWSSTNRPPSARCRSRSPWTGASPWCISRAWRSAASPTYTDAGVLSWRTPGEKIGRPSAEQAEIARLARELDLTRRRLAKTEAALDLVGKAHALSKEFSERADTEKKPWQR